MSRETVPTLIPRKVLEERYALVLPLVAQALAKHKIDYDKDPDVNLSEIVNRINTRIRQLKDDLGERAEEFANDADEIVGTLQKEIKKITVVPVTRENKKRQNDALARFLEAVQQATEGLYKEAVEDDSCALVLLSCQLNKRDKRMKELEDQIKMLKNSQAFLDNDVTALEKVNDRLVQRIKDADNLEEGYKRQLEDFERQVRVLEEQLEKLRSEKDELNKEKTRLQRELDDEKKLAGDLSDTLDKKEKELEDLKKELDDAKSSLRNAEDEVRRAKDKQEEMQRDIDALEALSDVQREKDPESSVDPDNKLYKELENQISKLEKDKRELEKRCDEWKKRAEACSERQEELSEELEELEDEKEEAEKEAEELEDKLEDTEDKLAEEKSEVERLEDEDEREDVGDEDPKVLPEEQWSAEKKSVSDCLEIPVCESDIISDDSYNDKEVPSSIRFKVNNPGKDLETMYIKLDDGQKKGDDSGVVYKFVPTDGKALVNKQFGVTIRPAPDGDDTSISFPGFDIVINVSKEEFDPLTATSKGLGAIVTVKTLHKSSNGRDNEKNTAREDDRSYIVNEWKRSDRGEAGKTSEEAFVKVRGPFIESGGKLISTTFQIPKIGDEKLENISFDIKEAGTAGTKICTKGDTKELLDGLFLENGLSASVKVRLEIFAYEAGNDLFSENDTNVDYLPDSPDDIGDELTIRVYLCAESIKNFDQDKSYVLTLSGTGTKGATFSSTLTTAKPEGNPRGPRPINNTTDNTGTLETSGSGTINDPVSLNSFFTPQIDTFNQ